MPKINEKAETEAGKRPGCGDVPRGARAHQPLDGIIVSHG